ncbi:dnaJ homolog subfamily C member 3-like [Ostrea edulis]|uniref:dnaJ homolog subfamily C member 3-like n=1 Tax=Ostrea edulis TaxID=37623 RepID=UPI0020955570|nr:dnaJ homolog subfamily C member 3-like [Ostrea edulis]
MIEEKITDMNIGGVVIFTKSLFIFLLLDVYLKGSHAISSTEVEQHLEMGKKLLAAGQLAEALQHYHSAVDGDPHNYLTYFRRATVFLALGKSKSALPDLTKVIELKPDFTAARIQRGNVLLKQGKMDDAEKDFAAVLERGRNDEAYSQMNAIADLRGDIQEAYMLVEHGQLPAAVEILGKVIEKCPWDPNLHETRAECYIQMGEYYKAISDIRPTTSLRSDNRPAFYKMSDLYYKLGEAEESLIQIRECLKLDPDDKQCQPHYKKVKKLVKQINAAQEAKVNGQYDECLNKAKQFMKTEPDEEFYQLKGQSFLCHCHAKGGNIQEAMMMCNRLLNRDPDNIDALMDRGDAYLASEKWDEAINDFQRAANMEEGNRRAQEGIHRAQKLLKQSKKRDYYKILGVRRTARKKEILKAYRKLAAIWHPDKYDGDDKSKAEKMFIDIASAKEVLTDPEKRRKFDEGEDPLDPEQQQQGGGPFWHEGFNPFGGSGFKFKFNFN